MEIARPSKAIFAGFVATLVMTGLAYLGPSLGMPKMDFAATLGSIINNRQMPAPMSEL